MWYGFHHREDAFEETEPHFAALLARLKKMHGDDYMPSAIYIDNCCSRRTAFNRVFPGVPILLDPFHWFARWDEAISIPSTHKLRWQFRAMLRDAVLVPDPNDVALLTDYYPKKKRGEIYGMCRRVVPPPKQLRENIENVLNVFVKRDTAILAAAAQNEIQGNETDEAMAAVADRPLFFNPKKFASVKKKQMKHVCRVHLNAACPTPGTTPRAACQGCLSDPPGARLYTSRPAKASRSRRPGRPAPPLYFTSRGSSQSEAMHRLLRAAIGSTTCGTVRAEHAVGSFIYRWNIDRGIDKLGDVDYHTYHHETLAVINSIAASFGLETDDLPFPKLNINERGRGTEKFGMECQNIVDLSRLNLNDDPAPVGPEDESPQDVPQPQSFVQTVYGDGRCLYRAFAAAASRIRPALFTAGIDWKNGNDLPVRREIINLRTEAARRMRTHRESRAHADRAPLDNEASARHGSWDRWFEEMTNEDDLHNEEAPNSRWGDHLMLMGLGLAFGFSIFISIIHPDGRVRRTESRVPYHEELLPDGTVDVDAPSIHLAWHVDDQGDGRHFDVIVEDVDQGGDDSLKRLSVNKAINNRTTSFDHLGKLSGMKDKAPTPFNEGPDGEDERRLFEELHKKYTRSSSSSYQKFMTEWTERVITEVHKQLAGDAHLKLRLKTMEQLYDEYDRRYNPVEVVQDLTPADQQNVREAYRYQRADREATTAPPAEPGGPTQVPPPPPAERQPVPFPGVVPFCCALPNAPPPPGFFFPRGPLSTAPATPWGFIPPPPRPTPAPRVDGRTTCLRCGRPTSTHAAYGRNNCTFPCKCGRHVDDPLHGEKCKGPYCTLPPLP